MSNVSCVLTANDGTIVKAIDVPADIAHNVAKVWAAHTRSPYFATLTVNGTTVDYMSEFLDAITLHKKGYVFLDSATMQS